MKSIIRPATTKDAASIAAILQKLGWFNQLNTEPTEITSNRIANHICRCLADDSHSIFVAEIEKTTVVGYAAIHWLPYLFLPAPEGFLSELFVDQDYCNQGIGKQLLETVTTEARSRGCSRLMLVNSRQRQSYARRFYQKRGWVEREQIANFVYPL